MKHATVQHDTETRWTRSAWEHYREVLEDLLHYGFIPAPCIVEIANMLMSGPSAVCGYGRVPFGCPVFDSSITTRIVDGNASMQDYVFHAVLHAMMIDRATPTHTLWQRLLYWNNIQPELAKLKRTQENP